METQPKAKNNAAWWVVLGVLMGFGLPVLGFSAVVYALGSAVGALADKADSDDDDTDGALSKKTSKIKVSGPATGPAVALVDVWGTIQRGEASSGTFGEDSGGATSIRITRLLEAADKDPDVKAVVLRVNSPGGSVVASDEIYRALKDMKKPIVAVMGEIAASGGVYVSMGAQHIIAHPDTFTGSIGVIMSMATAEDLLQKIGVHPVVIKSGKYKDIGSPTRAPTDEEKAQLQKLVEESYTRFVEIVADSRKSTPAKVREFADGRILSGRQALSLGLVDALGTEKDAIKKAAELGNITAEPRVLQFRSKRAFLEELMEGSISILVRQMGLQARGSALMEYR